MTIKLLDSDFYYSAKHQIYVKGFILHDSLFYEKELMAELALKIIQEENWKALNGRFIILYKSANKIVILSDLIRSYPLFYSQSQTKIYLSQEASKLLKLNTEIKLNQEAAQVFYHSGYCIGQSTLIECIAQTQAAEILTLYSDYSKNSFSYFDFIPQKKLKPDFNTAKTELKKILFEIFTDYLPLLEYSQVVLPLSGGWDSRLIAFMLHELKIENVICFTYGKRDNAEVQISKQVAEKLNFKWIFVDYEALAFPNLYDKKLNDYLQFMANYSSMPFLQEYLAVKHLKENSLIPENSLIIPGHSADFTAGSHLRPHINEQIKSAEIKKIIIQNTFFLNGKFHPNTKPLSKHKRINCHSFFNQVLTKTYITNIIPIRDKSLQKENWNFYQIENWNYHERQTKFIVNSARIFNYFGYDYILPFWDRRFQNFFRSLPYSFRLYKKLYNSILSELFKDRKINFQLSQMQESDFKFRKIKSIIKIFLPHCIKKHRLSTSDWMNYETFTKEMLIELQKIGYKFPADEYNAIITAWYLKKLALEIDKTKLYFFHCGYFNIPKAETRM